MGMKTIVAGLAGVILLSLSGIAAEAANKKCKAGYEYDPKKNRCVLVEGS
jgi:hypothetical protein